ncbi:uncharacterized protein I206_107575 [Kwoniella pini CBS 10737]|uniref:PXA domain-containing protein n=1 Tax=Kwoniella pini CBS 10737 TaxID=1296096 RepID=A0A1B9HXR1_9TREE|nr:uncharacterized protein I206_05908 [Kwoniella pini CBS 10737]OCF48041.1 hypothetical protein I206_05908 [Kwoniella pini CBS 10737]
MSSSSSKLSQPHHSLDTPTTRNAITPSYQIPGLTRSKSTIHLPLYRRILFPHDDPSSIIPQIVRGQGKDVDLINERLYHLIALTLRAYVQSWYNQFSSNRTLSPLINKLIIQPILSPILTDIYLNPDKIYYFILIDLPIILNLHLKIINESKLSLIYLPISTSTKKENKNDLAKRYNNRLPLLSIIEKEKEEEEGEYEYEISDLYLKAISSSILNFYIPSNSKNKENQNEDDIKGITELERIMIKEIFSNLILRSIINKSTENWFWYQIILKLLGEPDSNLDLISRGKELSNKSIIQLIIYWFNNIIKTFYIFWNGIFNLIKIYSNSNYPKNYNNLRYQKTFEPIFLLLKEFLNSINQQQQQQKQKYKFNVFLLEIIEFLLNFNLINLIIDKILYNFIKNNLLNLKNSLNLINFLENILFPINNNQFPLPSQPIPTENEIIELKLKLIKRLNEIIPSFIKNLIFNNNNNKADKDIENLLNLLENRSCNSHLIALILNCLIATLIPDLVISSDFDYFNQDEIVSELSQNQQKEEQVVNLNE